MCGGYPCVTPIHLTCRYYLQWLPQQWKTFSILCDLILKADYILDLYSQNAQLPTILTEVISDFPFPFIWHCLISVVVSAWSYNLRISTYSLWKGNWNTLINSFLLYDTVWFGRQYVEQVFQLVVLGREHGMQDQVASCTCMLCDVQTSFNSHLHVLYNCALKMEAVYSSETLISTYQTTWCCNAENHNMNLHHCQNLKS